MMAGDSVTISGAEENGEKTGSEREISRSSARDLRWIEGGEAILAKWREQKGKAAEQMAEAMARRLLKLRKDAKALKQLSAEKQEKKMKAKKNK
jgi:hypothetical protein